MKRPTHVVSQLPPDYHTAMRVDLMADKKQALTVNALALAIAALMGIGMHHFIPFDLFDSSRGALFSVLRAGVLLLGLFAYIPLHELVHGVTMKFCGCQKVDYGFNWVYAYAGSREYFPKNCYLVIALAPIAVWGAVLLGLNVLVPRSFFWVVYFIQITNISGAAGDLYVTWLFRPLPKDILIQDTGISMTVYQR